MPVERTLTTLNATIADTKARVTALEKRKAGGAGVKIYVGPDYKGDGPKLITPAIPNPEVHTNHAIRRDPIRGFGFYTESKDGGMVKYDFDTDTWKPHTQPGLTRTKTTTNGYNGWCVWDDITKYNHVVNLRTGQKYRVNHPAWSSFGLIQNRYLLVGGGSYYPGIFDTQNPGKNGDQYTLMYTDQRFQTAKGVNPIFVGQQTRENNKEVFILSAIVDGQFARVSWFEWDAAKEAKYQRDEWRLTSQGNLLAKLRKDRPDGTGRFDLLSGADGRFLGAPNSYNPESSPLGWTVLGATLIADQNFSNPIAFSGINYIDKDSLWKDGYIGHANGGQVVFFNKDGSFNRAVQTNGNKIFDYDL